MDGIRNSVKCMKNYTNTKLLTYDFVKAPVTLSYDEVNENKYINGELILKKI